MGDELRVLIEVTFRADSGDATYSREIIVTPGRLACIDELLNQDDQGRPLDFESMPRGE